MSNYFDQFDEPNPQRQPNFFDQFDAPAAAAPPAVAPVASAPATGSAQAYEPGVLDELGRAFGVLTGDSMAVTPIGRIEEAGGIVRDALIPDSLQRGWQSMKRNNAGTLGALFGESEDSNAYRAELARTREAYGADLDDLASIQAMSDAQSFGEFTDALAANPSALGEVIGESLGQQAIPLATMALSLPVGVAASGLTSFEAERQGSIDEAMAVAGVDLTDPVAVGTFLASRPDMVAEAERRGMIRGGVIGAADALTAGLAGRFAAGTGMTRNVTRTLADAALGLGGGAGVEAAAQLATDGEVTRLGDVLIEGAAEAPTTVIEGVSGLVRERARQQQAAVAPPAPEATPLPEPNAEPPPAAPVQPRPAARPDTPFTDEAAADDILAALMDAGIEPPPIPEQGGNPAPAAPAAGSQPGAVVSPLGEQFNQPAPSSVARGGETPVQDPSATGQAVPRRAFEDNAAVARRSTVKAYLDEGIDPDLAERLADNPFLPKGAIRDDVTGYFDGKVSGAKVATVKRAQEFVAEQGEDAVYVSGDIFNLGGLNNLFKNNMEAANVHFRAMTDFALDALRETGADVVPMRTGGDEVGFVVVNASQEVVNRALETADARIKEYARANGFDQVPHAKKDREGEFGIGLHFGTAPIEAGQSVDDIMSAADRGVDASKNRGKANESGSAARPAGLDGQDPRADRGDRAPAGRADGSSVGGMGRGEGAPVPERAAAAPVSEDDARAEPGEEVTRDDVLRLREEIGWSQKGGSLIRGGPVSESVEDGADFGRATGEVTGRTTWIPRARADGGGESGFWRNRPMKISKAEAEAALDRFAAGERLTAKQQEFIDYAERTARQYAQERAADAARVARTAAPRDDVEADDFDIDAQGQGSLPDGSPPFQRREAARDSGIPAGLPAQQTAATRTLAGRLNRYFAERARRAGRRAPPELRFREIDPASLPDAVRRALAALGEATGTRVVVVRNLTPEVDKFNGVSFGDGVIYIDESADRPAVLTAAHEWVHQLKRDDPAAYQRLEDEVRRQGSMPAWIERMAAEGNKTDEAGALEELTADAVADAMIDPAFLRRVVEEGGALRRAARSFLRFLDGMLGRIRGRNTAAYLSDVQAFRDELAAVLRQYQRRFDAPTDGQMEVEARQFPDELPDFQRRGQGDLFAPPTTREALRAEQEARDARRDGRAGTGRTDMMAGDGELFAGDRPEQGDIEGDPRIMFQRRSVPQARAEAVQKRRIADSGLGNPMNGGALGWQVRAAKWIGSREAVRKARAIFQDKMIALRDTQQDIEAALGRALPDLQNAYQVENLMHGRVQRETESLDDRLFDPLFDALRAAKVTVKQFEEYLYARHAKERNREIAAINPRMPDGGSGMSNADADRILAASDRAVMEPLARRVDAIVAETRKRMLDSGVITREVYDALTSQYQHYVPLRGKDESKALAERSGAGLGGGGLDLRNAGLKGALGRATLATNLLGEVIGDAQRSVVLAENARVGRSLARLVLANPNPAFWQMEAVRTEQAKDSQGQVYQRVMDESSQPDVVHVMIRGEPYRIRFADQNLADALRNIGGTGKFITLPVIRQLASFQRYIAATLTAWNPGFTAVNIARDLQFGLARIGSEHGLRDAARVLGGYPSAIRAMWRLERKKGARQNSRMDRYANEFEAAGGKTGWMHVASVDALTKSAAWKSSGSPLADARRAGEAILKAIEDLNDTFENAMRLSYYARLRDGGMSAQQAASKAKDLTVNFNRKGYAGPAMSAGYLFFNAAVQGTHALGRSVDPSKPAGRKILAGLTGLSVLQFMLAAIASGMEDDEGESYASKVPPQIKERNLWMVGSDGQVYTIPMPFGFNIATYAGSRMQQLLSSDADDIASGAKTTGQVASAATSDLFRVAISAVFPVQIAQSGLASIIPTELGQHIIQQTANANDFGQQIWAKNPYDRVTPASMLGRDATPEGYKAIATMLNRAGGGDDFTKPGIGMLDVAPEQVQFFVEFLTGGTGRFFGGLAQTGYNVAFDPEANEQRPTPIVQTFMRPVNEVQATAQRYYARRESIEVAADRIRTIANTEGVAAALDYADTLPFMAGVSVKLDRSGQAEIRAGNSTVYAAFKEAEKAGEAFRDERQQVYAEDSAMFSATRAAKLREASKAQMEAQKAMLAEWNAATEGWAVRPLK